MSTSKKIIIWTTITASYIYYFFGLYEIIFYGFAIGEKLISQFIPIVVGSTTLFFTYARYFRRR